MPAVAPKPHVTHAAFAAGVALVGGELQVGQRLAADRDQPKGRTGDLE